MQIRRLKGKIAILTGGGDVPGLNHAIRGIAMRAMKEGYVVTGIKRGWSGLINMKPDYKIDNSEHYVTLTEEVVSKAARTGGTFLHSSRLLPDRVEKNLVPEHLKDRYTSPSNDMTEVLIQNLNFLKIESLIVIGCDDTLQYSKRLSQKGIKIIAIPKTMDNDVPGTDYCIGFSTCVNRTVELINILRTTAGSHERISVVEVFGMHAGFTAITPTIAGAAHRCVIPEYTFDIDRLTELLVYDRRKNRSKYAIVITSEGAKFNGDVITNNPVADKSKIIGSVGDLIGENIREISKNYNNGREIEIISQKLGYLMRGGLPDIVDSIVPVAMGNIAIDLLIKNEFGRLVVLKDGKYGDVSLDVLAKGRKTIDINEYYDINRLRPNYSTFNNKPLYIVAG